MRINSRKIRKILEKVWTAPKRIVKPLHSRSTEMQRHECNNSQLCFNSENQTKDFSYAIFSVKKNKYWKNFRIIRKLLFNYSFYSRPQIGNFGSVTRRLPCSRRAPSPTPRRTSSKTGEAATAADADSAPRFPWTAAGVTSPSSVRVLRCDSSPTCELRPREIPPQCASSTSGSGGRAGGQPSSPGPSLASPTMGGCGRALPAAGGTGEPRRQRIQLSSAGVGELHR
jgi:hypothetical protein